MNKSLGTGSIELVVLGLLAALIVVLAIPLIAGAGHDSGGEAMKNPVVQQPNI